MNIAPAPDVIVVGLGAVGAATLYQLARRGVSALGVDRWSPPHDRGSSHGETRITRQGIGEGKVYAPLAIRSHALWRELENATGDDLLLTCGALVLEPADGGAVFHGRPGFVARSQAAAIAHGVAHELLDADEMSRRFPQLRLGGDERGYFEPGGGLVYPERCIAAQLGEAERLGARILRDAPVSAVLETRDGVVVETGHGALHAGAVVLAAGAWTPGLIGAPLSRLAVQPQALFWFEPDDPALYCADRFPTFIWSFGPRPEDAFYGFPIAPGAATAAVKVAGETSGAIDGPPAMRVAPDAEAARVMFDTYIARRLTGVSPRVTRSATCLYTMAPDGNFVVGHLPGRPRTLVASACSGHGFKHSAALGEILAEASLSGRDDGIPAAFEPARLAMTAQA